MRNFILWIGLVALVGCYQNSTAEGPPHLSRGETLYQKLCANCHHPERIGKVAPPLLPEFLKRKSKKRLHSIISKGLPSTQMPSFGHLADSEIDEIIDFIKTPGEVRWTSENIQESFAKSQDQPADYEIEDFTQLTACVERGRNEVFLLEDMEVLDRFYFGNVHGGIKFTARGDSLFVPSRDGWIGKYDLEKKRFWGKIRAAVYLRNICLSRDDRYLMASAHLPRGIAIFKAQNLEFKKWIPVPGKISALYEFTQEDQAIFTFRDKAKIGLLDTKTLKVKYIEVEEPFEDFFLEPQGRYLIGSSRRGKLLRVYDLKDRQVVFEKAIPGMPHLFSAAFWYRKGQFYFATPHMRKPLLTVWRLYDWKLIKKIDIGGDGFFVRTHPQTPYLWADNGSDELVLVDKSDYSLKKIVPTEGLRVLHTEFSGKGDLAYISLFSPRGSLAIYDGATLRKKGEIKCSLPVGKYNFRNKQRRNHLAQLGSEVFMNKCWGCHHQEEEAFGPSFTEIAKKRKEPWIRAQLLDPRLTSRHLGYKRNAMPKIPLSKMEIEALLAYFRNFKENLDK